MKKKSGSTQEAEELRERAELELTTRWGLAMVPPITDEKKLLHELQIHQIELELQNEALQQAQILLETSRDKYRDRFVELFDFAPVGYLTLNADNLILEINLTAASLLGCERKNLILRNFSQYIMGESRYHWQNYFPRFLQNGENQICELIMQHSDGSTFDARVSCSFKTSNEGKPSLLIALTDVSEQKLKERQLIKSEQRYANILESAMDAIITIDAAQRIILFNTAAETMFGCLAAEAIGSSLQCFIPEQSRHIHAQQIYDFGVRTTTNRKMDGARVHGLRSNGEVFPIEASISSSGMNGEKQFTAILRDISDRKRTEKSLLELNEQLERRVLERTQELVHSQHQAEAANRAKSNFLANMSHEIRTPMNGIVGLTDVLLLMDLTQTQRRLLSTIQTSSLALLTILNDILDFSKIEANKLEVERVPTSLRRVIDEVWQLMGVVANRKNTQLELFVDPELPLWIFSDPLRLQQILVNLLSNALKFVETGEEGKVILHVQPVTHPEGSLFVQFRVIDNGIGITQEMLDKLFKADESMARKYGGTGLGLSITKSLVELLQGEIRVNCNLERGAEFIIELPLLAAPPGPQSLGSSEFQGGEVLAKPCDEELITTPKSNPLGFSVTSIAEPMTSQNLILLAEDNPINQEVMCEQLGLLGYSAEMAEDGEAALAKWRNGRYALLLTDCQMPKLDGYGLAAAIRKEEPAGSHLPIIAVTANAMLGERERCLQCGMDDVLSKPFRLDQLRALLNQWLPPLPQETQEEAADDAADPNKAPAQIELTMPMFPVWDAAVLPRTVGDNLAFHRHLLAKFLIDGQERVMTILDSALAGDMTTISQTAHTLKSVARTLGAMQLGELSQALESIDRNTDAQGCQALVDGLQAAFDRCAVEIKQSLAKNQLN